MHSRCTLSVDRFHARRLFAGVLASGLHLTSCEPARTISVTSTTDGAPGSLRRAIDQANAVTAGAVQIELSPGTYTLTECVQGQADDANASGDLDLNATVAVSLVAKASSVVIRQTCAGERVLEQRGAGVLRLVGIRIEGGKLVTSSSAAQGGGVRVKGDAVLERSAIVGNSATTNGAGLFAGLAFGGGLYVGGSLVALDSEFSSNTATAPVSAEGGGAYVVGAVETKGGHFTGNRAKGVVATDSSARGGGIAQLSSAAQLHFFSTAFTDNVAEGGAADSVFVYGGGNAGGGAISSVGPLVGDGLTMVANRAIGGAIGYSGAFGSASGGAINATGAVKVTLSAFTGNGVAGGNAEFLCRYANIGGQILPTDCLGSPTGGEAVGPAIWTRGKLDLFVTTISNNVAQPGMGGNVIKLVGTPPFVIPTVVPGSLGATGATIKVAGEAPVYLGAVDIYDNPQSSLAASGPLRALQCELIGNAGGMIAASMELDRCTIANNNGPIETGSAILVNTTVTGNAGGVSAGFLKLDHATVVDNTGFTLKGSRLTTNRSLVVTPAGVTACEPGVEVDPSEYNWFGDASCALTSATNRQEPGDFRLQPLAENGGPVRTRAPAAGSALIDQVPTNACELRADARGAIRPQGNGCDIGAVEFGTLP